MLFCCFDCHQKHRKAPGCLRFLQVASRGGQHWHGRLRSAQGAGCILPVAEPRPPGILHALAARSSCGASVSRAQASLTGTQLRSFGVAFYASGPGHTGPKPKLRPRRSSAVPVGPKGPCQCLGDSSLPVTATGSEPVRAALAAPPRLGCPARPRIRRCPLTCRD